LLGVAYCLQSHQGPAPGPIRPAAALFALIAILQKQIDAAQGEQDCANDQTAQEVKRLQQQEKQTS
jgi:hypothetical protein